jgi:hypothetical protein
MNRKIFALALSALLYPLCLPVAAQQPTKIPRTGYLSVSSLPAMVLRTG